MNLFQPFDGRDHDVDEPRHKRVSVRRIAASSIAGKSGTSTSRARVIVYDPITWSTAVLSRS